MRFFKIKIGLFWPMLFLFSTVFFMCNTTFAEETTWNAIKNRGTLRIGVVNTPPWFLKDPSTRKWSGLGYYIGKEMADALNVKLDPVEVQWGTSVPALQANKIDLMLFLDSTPQRAKAVAFPTVPVVDIPLAVLHQNKIKAESWKDLNKSGVTVAVPQGTSMDAFITKRLTKAEILRFPSNAESVAAFQSGRSNVVCMFLPPLVKLQKKIGRGTITLPKPAHSSSATVALRYETDKRFFDWVSSSIFYWYNTGKIDDWFKKTLIELDIDPNEVPGVYRAKW
ncbi:MAG: transporter substrate-binding domain-containing protein [Deltaproteobacteria bacterium]|jgi:polar amino acid transport system substrate-binding protein|nr:transporter substrate-binding domain-containing protein [Deltaproteobacteria bacterium]